MGVQGIEPMTCARAARVHYQAISLAPSFVFSTGITHILRGLSPAWPFGRESKTQFLPWWRASRAWASMSTDGC